MNIIEAIQERCNFIRNTIIPEYDKLGPSGMFGTIMLQHDIANAEAVIASGDVAVMVTKLQQLRETCERAL